MFSWTETKTTYPNVMDYNPYNFQVGDVVQALGGNAPGILGKVAEYTDKYVTLESIKDLGLLEKYTGSRIPQLVYEKIKLTYKSNLDFFILEEMPRGQRKDSNSDVTDSGADQSKEIIADSDLTNSYESN